MTYGELPSSREFSRAFRAELGDEDYDYTLRGTDARVADRVGIPDSGSFDEDDEAGDLASGILYTLGFEWV